MTEQEITKLFERLGRLSAATRQKAGNGESWEYTFPNGQTHKDVVHGIKSLAEAEDDILNLLNWIWAAKDYLKARAKANGKNPQIVEDAVNANQDLQICGDLANLVGHGTPRKGRSNQNLRMGTVCSMTPGEAIGSITVRGSEVETQIADPGLVVFYLPVITEVGNQIGDAFEYA